MAPEKLKNLLAMVASRIMRSSLRKEAIGPRERLCVTLCYLASGDSRGSTAASYRIRLVIISRIINEACLEISNLLLQKGYIASSEIPDDWKETAGDYYWISIFPNCIGSTDGKNAGSYENLLFLFQLQGHT